jgi:CheY-like chemotaxis protein
VKGLNAPQQAAQPRPGRSAAHILVIDDDRNSREMMRLQLGAAGYRVSTAEDAVEAGHYVAEHAPDLLVVDVRMPYMGGVEFVAALRGDPTIPDIPAIFVTHVDNSAHVVGRTFGFPLLTKPLVADELLSAAAALLA